MKEWKIIATSWECICRVPNEDGLPDGCDHPNREKSICDELFCPIKEEQP